jgi:DNA-binding transcriptional MerR regulator
MRNDTQTYSSKDVAKRLTIQPVTVRKYSQMLEEQGYSFTKDDKGWRRYSEEDIGFLKYLGDMKAMGKSLDESIKHIATLYRGNLSISQPAIPLHENNPLVEFIKSQNEFNQKILERLEANEIRQIERDKNLLIALRETQEVKKQIAATQQKKWWMFWK